MTASVVEQAAIAGALRPIWAATTRPRPRASPRKSPRGSTHCADETERGWEGRVENGGYVFTRALRGVRQALMLDAGLLASADARRLDEHAATLARGLRQAGDLARRGDETQISGAGALLDAVMAAGRKGTRTCSATKAWAR